MNRTEFYWKPVSLYPYRPPSLLEPRGLILVGEVDLYRTSIEGSFRV